MFGLANTGSGLNLVKMDYHKSVIERHPNLVQKFAHLKDMDDMDTFNKSGIDGGKGSKQEIGGFHVTEVITYKNPMVGNQ